MLDWATQQRGPGKSRRMTKNNILVYGGSFDPVHNGHMSLLVQGIRHLQPRLTYVFPTHLSGFKFGHQAPFDDRKEMLELAISETFGAASSEIIVSDYEHQKYRVVYTDEILKHIRRKHRKSRLWFLGGSDILYAFNSWKRPRTIIKMCTFLIGERAGGPIKKFEDVPKFEVIKTHGANISSSMIRSKIGLGAGIRQVGELPIPATTLGYLAAKKLYRGI